VALAAALIRGAVEIETSCPALDAPAREAETHSENAPAMSLLVGDDGLRAVSQRAGVRQRPSPAAGLHNDHEEASGLPGE